MADEIEDAIDDTAVAPASASVDGASVSAQPLQDLIAAAKYKAANAAVASGASGWGATRPARVVPPGSVGEG